MSDAKLRELERRWRETGTVEDEAAYLRERVRVGGLTQERLELAACCGHEGATRANGHVHVNCLSTGAELDWRTWLRVVGDYGSQALRQALGLAAVALCAVLEESDMAGLQVAPARGLLIQCLQDEDAEQSRSLAQAAIRAIAPILDGCHRRLPRQGPAGGSLERFLEASVVARIAGLLATKTATTDSRMFYQTVDELTALCSNTPELTTSVRGAVSRGLAQWALRP